MDALNQRSDKDHIYSEYDSSCYANQLIYRSGIIPVAIWSNVECCFGIIGGCVATMRPLLRVLGLHSSGVSRESDQPTIGHAMHPVNKHNKRSSVSRIDESYRVIIETEGRKKDVDEDASETGSQRRILADGGLQIYKGSDVEVRTEKSSV